MASSISSIRPKHISDLPDLPMLIVFDHLPLLDLFNRIPLVCPTWTALQSVALKRRTKLVLDSWYKKKGNVNVLDTLPLPSTYYGWTTGSGGRLLRPEATEWLCHNLWAKLPNITQLSISPCTNFDDSIDDDNEEQIALPGNLPILEQAVRLVTTGQRWCSQLTSLRLDLVNYFYDEYPAHLADDVIEAINQRMPCLTVLYLKDLPNKPSVPLASQTLSRLRHLSIYRNPDWLWQSLCSVTKTPNQLQSPFRHDLRIEFQLVERPSCLMQRPNLPAVYDHIRALDFDVQSYKNGARLALHLIPERFHALRTLKLSVSVTMEIEDVSWRVLATALRCLAPLTSLMHLSLSWFHLLPVDGDDNGPLESRSVVVLSSLESLSISSISTVSHTDLGNAIDWHCLPRLRRLVFGYYLRFKCQQCHNGGDDANYNGSFFVNQECHRLAVEPLQVCSELVEVKLNNITLTRADLSAPFE